MPELSVSQRRSYNECKRKLGMYLIVLWIRLKEKQPLSTYFLGGPHEQTVSVKSGIKYVKTMLVGKRMKKITTGKRKRVFHDEDNADDDRQ